MPGRRRGARTGRGWDAAPPRPRAARARRPAADDIADDLDATCAADGPLWTDDEENYRRAAPGRYRPEHPDPTQPQDLTDAHGDTEAPGRSGARAGTGADRAGADGRDGRPEAAGPAPVERDPAELAREICLRQLAVRPRTRAELATALRRRGIADEVAAEVLDRYDEVGLIDDEAFARAWVTSRHHGRGLARRALAGELRQRGVDGELVGSALEQLDPATEAATARGLVERKLRGLGRAAPDVVFRRLVGTLARKGYPAGLAIRVVKDVLAERDAELAAFAEVVDPDTMIGLEDDTDEPMR